MKNLVLIFCLLLVLITNLYSQPLDKTGLDRLIKEYKAAVVIYDQNNNKYIKFNPERCRQRFTPASTYKIPNALIGLETGVIPDSNYVIKWDGKPKPIKEWERDHTLKSAIYYSVVPYFQELARRVGREKMQSWLNKINYGNKIIGKKEDYFWLDNSLKISADEQVEFLKKFYFDKLPFSKRSLDIVKSIVPQQDFKNAVLKCKTGTCDYEDDHVIAWLVGYLVKVQRSKFKGQSEKVKTKSEKDVGEAKNIYFFAFHVDAKTFDEARELRDKIKSEMLEYLGVEN